jgi:peptidase M50B-like protein
VADGDGLENHCGGNVTVGSNPTPSALTSKNVSVRSRWACRERTGRTQDGRMRPGQRNTQFSGIARPSPKSYIYGVGITQTPLPGPDAAAIGMAAFLAVYVRGIWALVKHFHVMAHEGMHAITATILGIRVRKVELKRNGDGVTYYRVPAVGGRGFLAGFVGYLGPSAFGLAAAGLIKFGFIVAALWAAVVFLALLLLKVLRSFGFGWISVPVVIGLFLILNLYASVSLQVVMAYLTTWVLLLSGFSMAVNHWTGAGDARILKDQTHLPRCGPCCGLRARSEPSTSGFSC